jgi:hypothetical protein
MSRSLGNWQFAATVEAYSLSVACNSAAPHASHNVHRVKTALHRTSAAARDALAWQRSVLAFRLYGR